MVSRRKLGTGKGQGYLNLIPIDSYIHGLNAKGVQTNGNLYAKKKEPKYPKVDTSFGAYIKGTTFRKDFGNIETPQKRGLIREIAKKVTEGVDWAVHWEKEHLPKQKEWVKKEFNTAKEQFKKAGKFIKKEAEEIKEGIEEAKTEREFKKRGLEVYELEKKKDIDDVRDELDTDDDGDQDISMQELKEANRQIKKDLESIDLNKDSIPDHRQKSPLEIDEEFIAQDEERLNFPFPTLNPKETFTKRAGRFIKKEAGIVKEKAGELVEKGKSYVREKQLEQDFIRQMPDSQVKELAVRTPSGFFGGMNIYEKEIIRRTKKRLELENELIKARKQQETDIKQGKTGFGDAFGFLNPFATLTKKGENK